MQWKVVDTNVAVVANGRAGQEIGPQCVRDCAAALNGVMESGRAAIDTGWRIIGEYRRNLNESGQRGPGDEFFKWLLTHTKNPHRCKMVPITPLDGGEENYEEFPRAASLEDFDPDDRKFVAVAAAIGGGATILEAVDSRWWELRDELRIAGIHVTFVCKQEIAAMRGRCIRA